MSAKVYFDGSSLDAAAKGYFNAIKDALKPEKFYMQAPTPQLLQKAQKAAVNLKRPIPRDAQRRILPHPSRGTKSDIFKKEDFKEVDSHALNAPASLVTANIEALVDYLVSPYESSDVSAVRAIFRWISGQDLRDYENHPDASSNSAAYYLNELKNSRGYDKIFNLMCEHARIPSASISGHSKGIGYNVGDPLTPSTRNIWNAVLLGDDWYLIDVHWASRKVSGVMAEEWQLIEFNRRKPEEMTTPHDIYEFDEFYFLTNPEEFIYSHFPDQEVWQLLARPMTHDEFLKVIHLKPTFFRFDLRVKSHPWCTLKSVDGAVNIELTTEREDLSFSYELYRSTKVDSGHQKLDKYLFLERNPEEKKMCIEIRFPTTGKFKAEIYGKDSKSKLEWLCSYVLYCDKPEANCLPLPSNARSEWGPGVDLINAGIIPLTHKRGKIFVDGIETEIKFKLKLEVDLIAQLMSVDEEKLDKYVLLGVMDNIATVNVRVPQKGQYALCIFAKTDPYQQQFVNICNYLVRSTEDFGEVEPYPQTNNSRVGPLDTFYKLGLKTTDSLPGLSTVSRDGTFTFSILVPEGTDYFPRMTLSTKEDFSEYVGWYRDDNVHFNLRFPKAGFYKFSLFAKSGNDEGGYPEVLCLVLEVPWPMTDCLPFPKRFTRYKDNYQIFSPNHRLLAADKTEKVCVFLPEAEAVALIEDGSWTHLDKTEDGIWQGKITPTETADTISMAVKSETGGSFSAILSFEVIPETDLNHIFLAQRLSHEEADQDYLERMSLRNNARKMSQGNSMMNQIQRIAKMKQQNLDDETLQRIQLQVDDDDDFEISPVNGQMSNELTNYLESQSGYDNSGFTDDYDDYVNDDQLDEDEDEDDEDEQKQNVISEVDINLNDIRKDNKMNETDIDSQVELEVCAENSFLTSERPFMTVSRTSSKGFGEISIENIPLRVGVVREDNIGESRLVPQYTSKTDQSLLKESVHPDKDVIYEHISDDPTCLSDSGNSECQSESESDSELSRSISMLDEEGNIKPEFMQMHSAPPPSPGNSNPEFSPSNPMLDEAGNIKPEFMHLYNAAPPAPPATSNPELLPSNPMLDEAGNIKPEFMHLYNAPPPPSPGNSNPELLPSNPMLDEAGNIKPEFMHLYNAAPPPPPTTSNPDLSPSNPMLDEAGNIKPEFMHLYNAAPPPPPATLNPDLSPSNPMIDEESLIPLKHEDMHSYNTAPLPLTPRDDFTEQLIKKVSEIEESVEKDELALQNFSYQELKAMDESVLRQRPLQSQPVINEDVASASVENEKPTSIVRPFVEADQKDEEVPLIKFVEYFIYVVSLLSLLLFIRRLMTWRPY